MASLKTSKQRDAILHNLQCRCDHPTAEQLYLDLKSKYPNLSLATVYRNLNLLEKHGTIQRISGVEADRFDGNNKAHYHLLCQNCDALIDIELRNSESINFLPIDFDGEIKSHSLIFYGICPKCKQIKISE